MVWLQVSGQLITNNTNIGWAQLAAKLIEHTQGHIKSVVACVQGSIETCSTHFVLFISVIVMTFPFGPVHGLITTTTIVLRNIRLTWTIQNLLKSNPRSHTISGHTQCRLKVWARRIQVGGLGIWRVLDLQKFHYIYKTS